MRKKTVMGVTLLLVLSLLLSACAAAGVAQEDYDAVVAERDAAQGQIEILQATAKYQDVDVALADGYIPASPCVSAPPGGMGVHYLNPGLAGAPPDLLKPAILLYLPSDDGVKLIGVEYTTVALASTPDGPAPWFKGEDTPPDSWVSSAPSILGQIFEGPMASHGSPDEPWHYDLHVWAWEENPSGMYADFNPRLSCTEHSSEEDPHEEGAH